LKYGVRQGLIGRNICDLVDPPSWEGRKMRTLTTSEIETLLAQSKDSYYYPVIYAALSSGLRQAELLVLRWRDLDLDLLSISVNRALYKRDGKVTFKEPKTKHSRRKVAMTPKLAIFLRDYHTKREEILWKLGKIISLDDLVFAHTGGEPLDPSVVSHEFHKIATRAGLGNVRFHDLRHSFASLMLSRGVAPKIISEALGHASVAFTMDTYSHIIEGMQEDAMSRLNDVLPAGVSENGNVAEMSRLSEKGTLKS
jgi:integrase